jgi:hypothetical protein
MQLKNSFENSTETFWTVVVVEDAMVPILTLP